jgi:demethoxyubiquinone hydroxylase (CLK1/Coq7/Cat5 family)
MNVDKCVDALNKLFRGELSAVETYRMAIDRVKDTGYQRVLRENLSAHEMRVNLLRNQIVKLGGTPSQGSGAWGTFAKLVQGGAGVFGEDAAISALEEGEDTGIRDYRDSDNLSDLDTDSLQLVNNQLLPAQERTHAALSALKQRGRAPV